jgi:hypothetical protein
MTSATDGGSARPPAARVPNPGLRKRLVAGLTLGLAVYLVLILYGDLRQLPAELRSFPWQWLPVVLGLTW